jgi:phage-related baseplate assembly protein
MAYGLSPRLYLENGPAVEAAKAQARSSATAYQSVWDALGREQRMAIIDRQLRAAA